MKYYVVADPHGYYTYLWTALEQTGFFRETGPCKLIVCGDLLDRGEEACKIVEFMEALMAEDKLIYIRGNHEDLFGQCLGEIAAGYSCVIASGDSKHYRNGTWSTMLQLTDIGAKDAVEIGSAFAACARATSFYQKLLPATVDYYETPNYIFCHGWIPVCFTENGCAYDENWRTATPDARARSRWLNGMEMACHMNITEPGKTIVCGHYHTSYGHTHIEKKGSEWGADADHTPFCAPGIIALDSCAARSGFLNCIVLEDEDGTFI